MIELLVLPLLMLGNLTADDFSAEADWSGTPGEWGVYHSYRWDYNLDLSGNIDKSYSPTAFGLPANTRLQPGVGPTQWFYVYSTGPEYSVYYDNNTYTNTTNLKLYSGYLHLKIENVYLISVYFSPPVCQYYDDKVSVKTKVTVWWYTRTKRADHSGYSTTYYNVTKTITYDYKYTTHMWPDLDAYNEKIQVDVTNHSAYTTINIKLPDDISHYKITAKSENHTAQFTKTNHIFHKLSDDYYYMEDFNIVNHSGIKPFGKNTFILPQDEYKIKVTAGSPFEIKELNLNVTYIDEVKETRELNKDYFIALLTLIIVGLAVKKYYGPY